MLPAEAKSGFGPFLMSAGRGLHTLLAWLHSVRGTGQAPEIPRTHVPIALR